MCHQIEICSIPAGGKRTNQRNKDTEGRGWGDLIIFFCWAVRLNVPNPKPISDQNVKSIPVFRLSGQGCIRLGKLDLDLEIQISDFAVKHEIQVVVDFN